MSQPDMFDDVIDVPASTMTFDPLQLEAIDKCCNMALHARVRAITGEAGTGKTSIMKAVYLALRAAGYRVAMAAPTGKAAKRIREATGLPASTIHQLLEYTHPGERNPKTGKPYGYSFPRRDRENPLNVDCVLIDEYAMVGVDLHTNLIHALGRGASIRMFGDANQLRPIEGAARIGQKSPFEVALERFDGTRLEHVYRQAEGSGILTAGHAIVRGRFPPRSADFNIRVMNAIVPELNELVLRALDSGVSYGTIENQIITPTRKSMVGATRINGLMRAIFNPLTKDRPSLDLPRHPWDKDPVTISLGDKVICNTNMYDMRDYDPKRFTPPPDHLQIMNGESGIVVDINTEDETFDLDVGDRVVHVPYEFEVPTKDGGIARVKPACEFSLAYVITTHKAQGSEYNNVIYMMHRVASWNQCRGNFYTAITRAKRSATLLSDSASINNSLRRITSQADENTKREASTS